MSFFFSFLSFFFKLWERERVYKIGYKEKQSQSYLSYLDGFLWRIFLVLRDDRLYLIFSTGLKIRLLLVQDFLRLFLPGVLGFGSVPTNPVQQLTFLLSISADGKESPLPFWGPLFFLPVSGDPSEVTKYKHLFLTVILWRLATVNSNTGNSINLISIVSVGDHLTIATLVSKQISYNSFKNEITYRLFT